jgi:hypothetical protein
MKLDQWVRALSNAQLLDQFEIALDHYRADDERPPRLELIHDEICRREADGTLSDDDWEAPCA